MFGFYDPASLSIGEKSAVINFINASDAADVTKVSIKTPADVRRVSDALEVQKARGITTLAGNVVEFRGSISFNPKAPDEALLTLDDAENFGRTVPLKLDFDLGQETLPRHGYAIGQAAEVDGALIVYKLAMRPFTMNFDRDMMPGNSSQLN
ncbi:hypothetical protein [Leisingera daeponensis]|uniref:hypothetical protein n=1 Tax=Leisingera daeponensis TaxID=405746 RepID=UPI001C95BF2B|nr:hypothetical protein [Leisingera daeponensis]MBY6058608.1 hypothetical protein [Leisingera daeponensis]